MEWTREASLGSSCLWGGVSSTALAPLAADMDGLKLFRHGLGGARQVHCHAEWPGPSGHGCNWLRQSYPQTFRPALSLLAPAHGSGLWPQNCLCIWGAAFSPTLAIEEVMPGADTMQGVSHTRVKIWLSIPGREGTKASSYPRLLTPFGAKKEKRWHSHCSQLDFPLTPLPVSQPLPQVLSLITL